MHCICCSECWHLDGLLGRFKGNKRRKRIQFTFLQDARFGSLLVDLGNALQNMTSATVSRSVETRATK